MCYASCEGAVHQASACSTAICKSYAKDVKAVCHDVWSQHAGHSTWLVSCNKPVRAASACIPDAACLLGYMHAAGYICNKAGLVWYGNACLQLEYQVRLVHGWATTSACNRQKYPLPTQGLSCSLHEENPHWFWLCFGHHTADARQQSCDCQSSSNVFFCPETLQSVSLTVWFDC